MITIDALLKCLCAAAIVLLCCLTSHVAASGNTNFKRNYRNLRVRLNNHVGAGVGNLRGVRGGRVEVSFDNGRRWGTICTTHWSFREGNVICRQLGLGFATTVAQNTRYGNTTRYPWAVVGTQCRGNERKLGDCFRETHYPRQCNATNRNIATVHCVPKSPDLDLSLRDIERTVLLESLPLSRLQCAMEENCLEREAAVIARTRPHARRDLLRFTIRTTNVGTADFSPYANRHEWQWHQCHRHFHSMEVFATFDIYNRNYQKVAQGHKASFCLMDSECARGIQRRYTCSSTSQGISIGCSDLYTTTLDCQWVDVTNLPRNRQYILRVAINPLYKIGEISYENNGAECELHFTGHRNTTRITRCVRAPLWFRI